MDIIPYPCPDPELNRVYKGGPLRTMAMHMQ